MKVIICGAGQVGSNIAHYLALEDNDVTVVDQSPALIGKLTDTLDCRGVTGHASHPDVLKEAGAENADMLIAVTYTDEINMVAAQVAHSLFNVPTKIARIRSQSYLAPEWQDLYPRQFAHRRDHFSRDRSCTCRDAPPDGPWGNRYDPAVWR